MVFDARNLFRVDWSVLTRRLGVVWIGCRVSLVRRWVRHQEGRRPQRRGTGQGVGLQQQEV